MAEIPLPIKPPTRDQLSRMAGGNQEMIRKLEMLFQQGGQITPDQVVILFQLAQEVSIEANTAAAKANEALASIEAIVARLGLLPVPMEQVFPDDLSPPIQIGTLAYQNAEDVEVGNLTVTGQLGNVMWGTYTPTLTNVANLDASTAYQCQYLRIANTVMVSGRIDVDPTAPAAATQLGISLPVASNIGAVEDCAGAAACSAVAGQSAAILGDAANNRAQMEWIAGDVTNQPMYFTFAYQVI